MTANRKPIIDRFFGRPVVWGATMTGAFYYVINRDEFHGSWLHRYTSEHAIEYIIVALFFWSIADLAKKCLGFRREWRALQREWLPPRDGQQPAAAAGELYAHVDAVKDGLESSRLAARLRLALAFVHERRSADGFGEYLRELAERDADRTHSNFALARFIGWITPIFGFLGTVVHFGTALGGLSPDQIVENLPTVVGSLGMGFNTTTVALAVAMLTMFVVFLVERAEQAIIRGVDERTEQELLARFAATDIRLAPFLDAVETAAKASHEAIQETILAHAATWSQSQQALEQRHEDHARRHHELWAEATSRQHTLADDQQATHAAFLQASLDRMTELQTHLGNVAETLVGVLEGEDRLTLLQKQLAENVQMINQTQHLDQALHGLTAAVHFLTARQQSGATTVQRAA